MTRFYVHFPIILPHQVTCTSFVRHITHREKFQSRDFEVHLTLKFISYLNDRRRHGVYGHVFRISSGESHCSS